MYKVATINRIIPFSNVDGYGNRMAVFFQGCPLTCKFCHNPETIRHCIHCGTCVASCPVGALSIVDGKVVWNKELCVKCDTCLRVCPNLSTPKTRQYTIDQLWEKVMEYRPFIRGITTSGGECMKHAYFIEPLFERAVQEGLSCLIDSNGYYDFREYPRLLELADGVMLDVKMWNDEKHIEITGSSNKVILHNLSYLSSLGKLYEVRLLMYPGLKEYNKETIENVFKVVGPDQLIKIIRYRPFGVREEGLEYFGNLQLSLEEGKEYESFAKSLGARNVILT